MDHELEQLTYKELQAMARQYQLPGNMKKIFMIQAIDAARKGRQAEVSNILAKVHETRKNKKVKKINPTIKVVTRNYRIKHEYYSRSILSSLSVPPNLQIQQEEDLSSRRDVDISNFDALQRYLTHRKSYVFHKPPNVMDLRTTEDSSLVQAYPLDLHRTTHPPLAAGWPHQAQNYSTASSNSHKILKGMLQAPPKYNFGESTATSSSSAQLHPDDVKFNNLSYDSDTLTAETDSCDIQEADNTDNRPPFDNIDPLESTSTHDSQAINPISYCPPNTFSDLNSHTSTFYQHAGVQDNCQKWLNQNSIMQFGFRKYNQHRRELGYLDYDNQLRINDQGPPYLVNHGTHQQVACTNSSFANTRSNYSTGNGINHAQECYGQLNIYNNNGTPDATDHSEVAWNSQEISIYPVPVNNNESYGQSSRTYEYSQPDYIQTLETNPYVTQVQEHQLTPEPTVPVSSPDWDSETYCPRWSLPNEVSSQEKCFMPEKRNYSDPSGYRLYNDTPMSSSSVTNIDTELPEDVLQEENNNVPDDNNLANDEED